MEHSIDENCIRRLDELFNTLGKMIMIDLERGVAETGLREVIDVLERLADKWREPCIKVAEYRDYIRIFITETEKLTKTLFNMAMEAVAPHVESLSMQTYTSLSMLLIGYATILVEIVVQAKFALEQGLSLETVEPLVYAAAARFLALCRIISRMRPSRLKKLLPVLAKVLEEYSREDRAVVTGVIVREVLGLGREGATEGLREAW